MTLRSFSILLITTILSFCALYAPQPILPLLAKAYSVTGSEVSLLISLALFPLGIAPIAYGYFMDNLSARTSLLWFIGLLAFSEYAFIFITDFRFLLALRLFQGLLFPGIFTALITYIGNQAPQEYKQKAVSSYIAATITGGFAGRVITGYLADIYPWYTAFQVWSVGLAVTWCLLWFLKKDSPNQTERIPIKAIGLMFQRPLHRRVYVIVFTVFFGFASVLNALPFRIKEILPTASETLIASVYWGYLVGVLVSLNAQRISARIGGEIKSVLFGLTIFGAGILMLLSTNLVVIYSAIFVISSGFFLMHSTLSAYINHQTSTQRGVANGLYIAFYYSGGSLGSYLPLLIYHEKGWLPYLIIVFMCTILGWIMTWNLKNDSKR